MKKAKNGDVCEESRNRKYCDCFAAAKAGQRLFKEVNWKYWIIYSVHWQHFSLLEVFFVYKLTVLHVESKCKFYKRFKTRFLVRTCMHVQVSTSYFKMLKHVSLYTKQFPIVGCGQISLLMPKTHSTVQRGSNSLVNETHLFILFTRSSEAFTDVCMFTRFLFHYLACTFYQVI